MNRLDVHIEIETEKIGAMLKYYQTETLHDKNCDDNCPIRSEDSI